MTMKRAYVTLIAGGDAYAPGVETLGRSVRASGSTLPMVLLCTPDVPAATVEKLAATGWEPRPVEPIANPAPSGDLIFARFGNTYTKLRAFALTEVEKAVFLDADTLVLRNIDELFERPDFAAAPDFFMPDQFNSGVMVLQPSAARFAAMEAALTTSNTYDGGDQGFLNRFFPDWWAMDVAHRLPARYNLHHFVFQFLAAHDALRRQFLEKIQIVHYTLQKPWMSPTVTGGSQMWWNFYRDGNAQPEGALRKKLHAMEDWTFDSVVRTLGGA